MSPRVQRQISPLNLYHVLILGNNCEDIYIDDEDKQTMIDILFDKSFNDSYDFYAYCILYNRANFLIEPKACCLSDTMKKVNMAYASYFNRKYGRSGPVFKDRFKSEAICDSKGILPVVGYIHHNPVLEGLCSAAEEYKFSSIHQYLNNKTENKIMKFCEITEWPENCFFNYQETVYHDNCFANMQDIASEIVNQYLKSKQVCIENIRQKEYDDYRQELVLKIRKNTGYSIRKISGLLGINRGEVYQIINRDREVEAKNDLSDLQ